MGQYCFAHGRLSSVVFCNAAGVRASQAHGQSARRRPDTWAVGRHCMAGQYGYVTLGQHIVLKWRIIKVQGHARASITGPLVATVEQLTCLPVTAVDSGIVSMYLMFKK